MFRFLLFDVDDTLYSPHSGLWEALSERISLFMVERLQIEPSEVPNLRKHFAQNYGTALNGLRHSDYAVDVDDYLSFVHDLPLEKYVQPNPALDSMLSRIPLEKVVFTNSDSAHSTRIMDRLGVAHHFSRIIDIRALEFTNKPDPLAYQKALTILNVKAQECIFVEDSLRNLLPAKKLGMLTVLVNEDVSLDGVDYRVRSVLEVEGVVTSLIRS